jgi:hypothetical protein
MDEFLVRKVLPIGAVRAARDQFEGFYRECGKKIFFGVIVAYAKACALFPQRAPKAASGSILEFVASPAPPLGAEEFKHGVKKLNYV